jgi:tRNA-splicing ligase RtcB
LNQEHDDMTDTTYNYVETDGAPLKMWTRGVPVEDVAMQQLRNVASLPFIHKHVAAMPDVHWGRGATIGSVIPTKGAIIPAACGVDLGCGMMAVKTSLMNHQLPDDLSGIRSVIEAAVPHGRTDNGGPNDRGAWGEVPADVGRRYSPLAHGLASILDRHPELQRKRSDALTVRAAAHLGTLGTGNHFIEVCQDEAGRVWVMLHSGSRGVGNRIGTYFIERAKKEMERWFIRLPDQDLAYLVEGSELFDDYVAAVGWAQEYALANRDMMMRAVLGAIGKILGPFDAMDMAVNCHHNYVERENHFGANVWVTRKGAVRARAGDLGIIPGSMGARSYIVRGKGNADSFHSCSHGAGRAMSRGEARRRFTLEDHAKATEGVECRKDEGVLDETPGAYKNIDLVMAAQADLIEVVHELQAVVCVKG